MLNSFKSNFAIILNLLLGSFCIQAQVVENLMTTADTTKTLFSNVKINTLGLYIAPEAQYSQLAGDFTGFKGGSIMAIFNKKFAAGASFQSNQRRFAPADLNANQDLQLRYSSAGMRLEYSFTPHKLVHLTVPMTVGFGQVSVDSLNSILESHDWNGHKVKGRRYHFGSSERFVYFQPALNIDVNIFKYGKWFIGAGYRVNVYKDDNTSALVQLTNAQLSGLTLQTGVKLGIFGVNLKRKQNAELDKTQNSME